MILFLYIYIIGYLLALIMLMYNESKYSNLIRFDLVTYLFMAIPSWFIVICELSTSIRNIFKE